MRVFVSPSNHRCFAAPSVGSLRCGSQVSVRQTVTSPFPPAASDLPSGENATAYRKTGSFPYVVLAVHRGCDPGTSRLTTFPVDVSSTETELPAPAVATNLLSGENATR